MTKIASTISSKPFLVALTVLLINDWILKFAFPGFITGKLSDFAFVLLTAMISLSIIKKPVALLIPAVFFVYWKSPYSDSLIEVMNMILPFNVGRMIDWTDLVVLLILPFSLTLMPKERLNVKPMATTLFSIFCFSALTASGFNIGNGQYGERVIEDDSEPYTAAGVVWEGGNLGRCIEFTHGNDAVLAEIVELQCDFGSAPLANLTGIDRLENLEVLDIRQNDVSDLTPLVELGQLKKLNVSSNPITTLPNLVTLANLNELDISRTSVADLSPLYALNNLKTLDISYMYSIKELHVLENVESLTTVVADGLDLRNGVNIEAALSVTHLELNWAVLNDLEFINSLPLLETLNINSALITNSGNFQIGNLSRLSAHSANLTGVEFLSNAPNLVYANLSNNDITALPQTIAAPKLEKLYMNNNAVAEIDSLASLNNLTHLEMDHNEIQDISSVSSMTKIELLSMSDNNIEDISPLSNARSLAILILSNNNISDISVLETLDKLTYIDLRGNNVTDISALSHLDTVLDIYVYEDYFTNEFELTKLFNRSVFEIWYADTDFSRLSEMTSVVELGLPDSTLSNLQEIAEMDQLVRLNIRGTNIDSLEPIASLTKLRELNISVTGVDDLTVLAALEQLETLEAFILPPIDFTVLKDQFQLKHLSFTNREGNTYPDFTAMTNLESVTIDNCGDLATWEEAIPQAEVSCVTVSSGIY